MRAKDVLVALAFGAVVTALAVIPSLRAGYEFLNTQYGLTAAFLKFALLATFGETLASRIRTGTYLPSGFGLLPRALVWGVLGMTIKLAFTVFGEGVPAFLGAMGLEGAREAMSGSMGWMRILVALAVSTVMNVVYAPVMMLCHKVSDEHLAQWGGSMRAFLHPVEVADILSRRIDWKVQWRFVYARTIPIFWIPAHTISFLLPPDARTLFAAFLSIVLGLILAIAAQRKGSAGAKS